jgi:hypothetical protein
MAEFEDNNAIMDLQRLTSKLDIKDDDTAKLDEHEHKTTSKTLEKIHRLLSSPDQSRDGFYVLVLVDLYSHQVCIYFSYARSEC